MTVGDHRGNPSERRHAKTNRGTVRRCRIIRKLGPGASPEKMAEAPEPTSRILQPHKPLTAHDSQDDRAGLFPHRNRELMRRQHGQGQRPGRTSWTPSSVGTADAKVKSRSASSFDAIRFVYMDSTARLSIPCNSQYSDTNGVVGSLTRVHRFQLRLEKPEMSIRRIGGVRRSAVSISIAEY